MPKIIDWTNQKYFNLTIIKKLPIKDNNRWLWEAKCDCGTTINLYPYKIKNGDIKHCGCKKTTTAKDWTGKSFNKLTFIKPNGRTIGSKILWEVLCKCGHTSNVVPYAVVSGKTKTCGKCEKPSQSKDWENKTQGQLTFIKRYKKGNNGAMIWEAQCGCGATIYTIPSNNAQSCGCLGIEASKKWCSILGKSGRKYTPEMSSANQVWRRTYKDGNIDFETFYKLSQLPCCYCGALPSNKTTNKYGSAFIYNGLDRINPSIMHTIENVVPCCFNCNFSKLNRSVEEFLSHARRIVEYQNNILITASKLI